jgi:hypothetical protein
MSRQESETNVPNNLANGGRLFSGRIAGLLISGMLFQSLPSYAWKVSTHIGSVNETLEEFSATGPSPITQDGAANTVRFSDPVTGRTLSIAITEKDAYKAITLYPEYFRAGIVGPDAFPDPITGQTYEHGNETPLAWKLLKEVDAPNIPDKSETKEKFEDRRTPSQYRAIDYAMAMLDFLNDRYQSSKTVSAVERGQIIAFIIGYIGHCVGDGFAHTWVNEKVHGAWSYTSGSGVFGVFSEEIKHVVLEDFVDNRLPGYLENTDGSKGGLMNKMSLSAPVEFLDAFYSARSKNYPALREMGNKNGDFDAFYEYFKNVDQFHGGPIYNFFNMQQAIGDGAIYKWTGADTYLQFFEDWDPVVNNSAIRTVMNIVDIPGQIVEPIEDFLEGDLLNWITMGWLDCDIGSGKTGIESFYDMWDYVGRLKIRLHNWGLMSDVVEANWQRMSQCTAENAAKLKGGDYVVVDPATHIFKDACAELARAPFTTDRNNPRALYASSLQTDGGPFELEFLADMKTAFLGEGVGDPEDPDYKTFEQANKHRSIGGNVDRLSKYLYDQAFLMDELFGAVFAGGGGRGFLDHACKLSRDDAKRRCLELKLKPLLYTYRSAKCLIAVAEKEAECLRQWGRHWQDCNDKAREVCKYAPGAYIPPIPRFCVRLGCCGYSYKVCTPATSGFYTPIYDGCTYAGYAACGVATTVEEAWCATIETGFDFGMCKLDAVYDLVTEWDVVDKFMDPVEEACDYIDASRDLLAEFRALQEDREKLKEYLRKLGLPVETIDKLKRIGELVTDKLREKPDHYGLNMVFLEEDLRQDPVYLLALQDAVIAKTAEVTAGMAPGPAKDEALYALDQFGEFIAAIKDDPYQDEEKLIYLDPFYRRKMNESIERLTTIPPAPSFDNSKESPAVVAIQNKIATLITDIQANPAKYENQADRDVLAAQINALEAELKAAKPTHDAHDKIDNSMAQLQAYVDCVPSRQEMRTMNTESVKLIDDAGSIADNWSLIPSVEARIAALSRIDDGKCYGTREKRDVLLDAMKDLKVFLEASRSRAEGVPNVRFNNFSLVRSGFDNLVEGALESTILENLLALDVLPNIPGPTATKVMAETGYNFAVDFDPFYNTVQGLKLAPLTGKSDVEKLFKDKGMRLNYEGKPVDLPWTDNASLYSDICKDLKNNGSMNVYCDVLTSNDDPNCFGCKFPDGAIPPHDPERGAFLETSLEPQNVGGSNEWIRRRGIVAYDGNGRNPVNTNFLMASTQQARTSLYENIFRVSKCLTTITTQPKSARVSAGNDVTLTVAATGTPGQTLAYQWRKNGAPITGQTGTSFQITGFQAADNGKYTAAVSDPCGVQISNEAELLVCKDLVVTSHLSGATLLVGSKYVLQVATEGEDARTYSWTKDGYSIPGDGPVLKIDKFSVSDAGVYTVTISQTCDGVVTTASSTATLLNGTELCQSRPYTPNAILNCFVRTEGPQTRIRFDEQTVMGPGDVLNIFDMGGRLVKTYSGSQAKGVSFIYPSKILLVQIISDSGPTNPAEGYRIESVETVGKGIISWLKRLIF